MYEGQRHGGPHLYTNVFHILSLYLRHPPNPKWERKQGLSRALCNTIIILVLSTATYILSHVRVPPAATVPRTTLLGYEYYQSQCIGNIAIMKRPMSCSHHVHALFTKNYSRGSIKRSAIHG